MNTAYKLSAGDIVIGLPLSCNETINRMSTNYLKEMLDKNYKFYYIDGLKFSRQFVVDLYKFRTRREIQIR